MEKSAIVTVATPERPDLLAATSEAIARQTVSCEQYIVQIGPGQNAAASAANTANVRLPIGTDQWMLAQGIGLQLAFNNEADIVASLAAGDLLERLCLDWVGAEVARARR